MVFRGSHLYSFHLHIRQNGSYKMGLLCPERSGGRVWKGGIALNGLVVHLYFPPSLIDCSELLIRQAQITTGQIERAGDFIFVFEDLFSDEQRKVQLLYVNGPYTPL